MMSDILDIRKSFRFARPHRTVFGRIIPYESIPKSGSKKYSPNGQRERLRRLRQIARGSLRSGDSP
jgi:hypothetical protein